MIIALDGIIISLQIIKSITLSIVRVTPLWINKNSLIIALDGFLISLEFGKSITFILMSNCKIIVYTD
jgi:hypothetical protein